ncbi:DUF4179 domain-containing protein [Paenibacillus faecalis]|uniref:DUF4179 domain-containing protein n=1 Tax=Paenibacillus faecalis TaxID=2079532 RepID=UPI000D0EDD2D|nr:DUF4179 domain-containing protein [Paenibacillus faecalis]
MDKLRKPTEFADMDAIEQMIRESSLPKNTMSYQIMNKIGDSPLSRRTSIRKPSVVKRTVLAAAATAIIGAGVIGTGFVSPVMADALKKVPMIGMLFKDTSEQALQAAIDQGIVSEPNLSVTHDGITLTVADVLYDGTRLSIILERTGVDLKGTASPYIKEGTHFIGDPDDEFVKSRMIPEKDQEKGYIETPTILVNGQKVESGEALYGDQAILDNTYIIEYSKDLNLPDQFDLTVQANVTGVKETFEFNVPVKVENKSLVLQPNATKSDGQFTYTVKEMELSPVSTRLVLDSKGPVPVSPEQTGDYSASMVYYEIVDDQGNVLTPSRFEYFHSKPKTEYHIDQLYSPLNDTPKSITIKPFTLTVHQKDWSVVGQDKDSLGDKTYLKDLELTIPVRQ